VTTHGNQLIFIVSAPRSGSTLLQRLLANVPEICTNVECFLMLHPLYALRDGGIETDYDHANATHATRHFLENFKLGIDIYQEAVRKYADTFYQAALSAEGKSYFLDKTPSYTHILQELYTIYPHAKYILLLREPLALLHSALTTWIKGRWENLYWCRYDLIGALRDLADGIDVLKDNAIIVRYEALVTSPETELNRLGKSLGIDLPDNCVEYFLPAKVINRTGSRFYGDPTGIMRYMRPNSDNATGWHELANDPQTLRFAMEYLDELGETLMTRLGHNVHYSRGTLQELARQRVIADDGRQIPWKIVIKPPKERSRKENLMLRRLKYINQHGVLAGTLKHLRCHGVEEIKSFLIDRS